MRVWALEEFMSRLYKVLFLAKLLGCVFGEPFCGVTLPLTYAIRKKKIVYPAGIQIINLSVHLHSSLAIRVSFAFMRL